MKSRSLNRIARGLGWTAAVAGTLGLALPAAAQTPPRGYRSARVATSRAPEQGASWNAAVDPATLHLVQTKVQMAWQADPATFGCTLGLTAGPQGIQVSGFVPNEGVRQRAMQLAIQHSGLPVVDGLKVHAGLPVRCPGPVSGEELRREATEALRAAFGDRAAKWQVSAGTDGRVTVSGPCASPDEQLQVVRSLSRAGHCACVTSQLTLGELPTAMALADRFPIPEPRMTIPEPTPARQTVVAWNAEPPAPPVAPPRIQEPPVESVPTQTEPVVPPAPPEPRTTPASLAEAPKMPAVEALPTVAAKTDGATTAPAEAKRAEGEVFETTGEIQWDMPADAKSAPASAETTRIQDAIKARCGADLREVRVEFLRDRRMHITLRVAPGADRGRVETQVRQIPEVAGYAHGTYMD
jgi:hypothetical protein